jgi:hypothetical protein
MSEELKLCPFCGEKPEVNFAGVVWCKNDNCKMNNYDEQGVFFLSPESWNTRPIEDELQRKLDIAVEAINEAIKSLKQYDDDLPAFDILVDARAEIEREEKK